MGGGGACILSSSGEAVRRGRWHSTTVTPGQPLSLVAANESPVLVRHVLSTSSLEFPSGLLLHGAPLAASPSRGRWYDTLEGFLLQEGQGTGPGSGQLLGSPILPLPELHSPGLSNSRSHSGDCCALEGLSKHLEGQHSGRHSLLSILGLGWCVQDWPFDCNQNIPLSPSPFLLSLYPPLSSSLSSSPSLFSLLLCPCLAWQHPHWSGQNQMPTSSELPFPAWLPFEVALGRHTVQVAVQFSYFLPL